MQTGVDASANCSSIAAKLKASGRTFVCRYYANSGKKRLTVSEARELSSAGLMIVVVWEDGFPTKASYFSRLKGIDDATSAYHDAVTLGQTRNSVIYFAVDYDASEIDLKGVVSDYFQGVAEGFKAIANGAPDYRVGVYGSGLTCNSILSSGLADYSWLAMSSGWRGHDFSQWNIKQGPGKTLGGIQLDYDRSGDDYGGFALS